MVRLVTDDDIGLKVLREAPAGIAQSVDVIAIHGIGAHPDDSWCKNVGSTDSPQWVNWLVQEDMLPALAPNARIMRYGYQSHWFGKDAIRQRTSTVAQRLLSALKRERKAFPNRPLIFIAHCFGGLVVLKALLDARVHEDDWPGIFISTTGLIFFGTPFRGAGGMSQAEMLAAAQSEYHQDDIQPEILRVLEPENEYLQDLVDQFSRIRRNANETHVACFYEQKPSNVGKIVGGKDRTRVVVSESSGCLDLSNSTSKHSLSRTHFDMNKFGNPGEEDFEIVGDAIHSIVEAAHTLILARTQKKSDHEDYSIVFSLSGASKTEHFVAREEELAQIDQVLRSGDGRQTVTLHGLGGIGKTQLAIAYAIRHRADFSAILWLNIKDSESVKQSFARAARRIATDCPSSGLDGLDEEKDLDKVVRAVNRWLDQPKNTRWLMVFDNYDNPKLPGVTNPTVVDIDRFLPEAYHGSVLITTRLAAVKLGRQIPIQKLSNMVDSLRILSDSSERNITAEDDDAAALVKELDGLPLALATAGAYLSQVATSLTDYLRLYNESWLRLLQTSPELESYEDRALYTTWQLSLDHIKQRNELSVHLLELWAYFDNHDLWFELLKDCSDGPEWLRQLTKDELEFTAAVRLICDHGLAEADMSSEETGPESKGYSLHSCVHSWTIHMLNQDWDNQMAKIALDCVGSHIPKDDVRHSSILQRRLLGHAAKCYSFISKSAVDTDGMGWALYKLGILYDGQVKLKMAEEMLNRALQGQEKVLGPEHIETLRTVNSLGLVYWNQGRLDAAEKMYNRALRGREKVLGLEHADTLPTVNNLGLVYWNQGKLDAAEKMYNRALQGWEKVLGLEHANTLTTVNNLAMVYRDQGKLDAAEQMYNRALRGREKVLGLEHANTLTTVNNLGLLYADQGKLDAAEQMHERALQDTEKALGPDHKGTLTIVYSLGELFKDRGNIEMAEQMYQRAMHGLEKALHPKHISTLRVVNSLGELCMEQDRLAEAGKMFERALQGYERALGPGHLSTLKVVRNLGRLAAKQGKLKEADQRYQQALQGFEKSLGVLRAKTYIPALDTLENIGQLYASMGSSERALEMNKRALEGVEAVFGRSSQRYSKLAAVIASLEKPVDIETLLLERLLFQ